MSFQIRDFKPLIIALVSSTVGAIAVTASILKTRQYVRHESNRQKVEITHALDKAIATIKHEKNSITIDDPVESKDPKTLTRWSEVEQKCRSSIVQVCSEKKEIDWLEPYKAPEVSESRGSGFFLNADGDVLTNYHVVGNTDKVKVVASFLGKDPMDATVLGVCPERDIALLRIGQAGLERIKAKIGSIEFLELGNSDNVKRGQEVLTMGFPLGKDHVKTTHGIISGWEKVSINEHDDASGQMCLEITAPINPGSSGGPLISTDGHVLGVNFAGVANASNVGYVIPISQIKKPISDLYKTKLLRKPRLGVAPQPTSKAINSYLEAPVDGGVYAVKVIKGMLAQKAGLKEGDLILQINGKSIDSHGELGVEWCDEPVHFTNLVNRLEIGDTVELIVWREGQSKTIKMRIEEAPARKIRWFFPSHNATDKVDYEIFGGCVFAELNLQNLVSLVLKNKGTKLVKYLTEHELQDESVLVVINTIPTSIAAQPKNLVYPGFQVKTINEKEVKTLAELRQEIKKGLSKKFFTVENTDNQLVVFNVEEVLEKEVEIASSFLIKPKFSESLSEALFRAGKKA